MCSIWRQPPKDIPESVIDHLPSDLDILSVTGGEPILAENFDRLIDRISQRYPNLRVVILTNGLNPDLLESKIKLAQEKIKKLGVGLSFDSLTENRLRGVKEAREKQKASLVRLKKLGIKDLRLSFVATELNLDQLLPVYNYAKKEKVDFSWNIVRNSNFYYRQEDNLFSQEAQKQLRKDISRLVRQQLSQQSLRSWLRAYVSAGHSCHLETGKRPLPCQAGQNYFFVNTAGRLYPCELRDFPFGDLTKIDFDKIIVSPQADETRLLVKDCQLCWGCAITDTLKQHWPLVIGWLAKNRLSYSKI